MYLLILLIFLLILDIILIQTTGLKVFKQIFTLIPFIDLFIDFRYYFDMPVNRSIKSTNVKICLYTFKPVPCIKISRINKKFNKINK